MLFQTTSAHEELRAKIRSFAEEEIKPLAFLMDQNNEFPEEAVKKLGKLGWMGIPYPKEYGGAGLDALSYAIAVEELARVDGGAGVILSAHVSLGSWPIFAYGTEEQKKKYLVPLAKGEKIGAFGLLVTAVALPLNFLPVIGQAAVFVLYVYYSALMFVDYPSSRYRWSLGDKLRWLRSHRATSFRIGLLPALLSMVPILNIFLMAVCFPLFTVHTTLNFLAIEGRRETPPEA